MTAWPTPPTRHYVIGHHGSTVSKGTAVQHFAPWTDRLGRRYGAVRSHLLREPVDNGHVTGCQRGEHVGLGPDLWLRNGRGP